MFIAGSLHLDIVVNAPHFPSIDETVVGNSVAYVCGGKGGNQAVAAARNGVDTAMAGRLGHDHFSEILTANLTSSGVDCSQLQYGRGESGMSVAIVDDNGDYGAVIVSAANLELDPSEITIPERASVLLLQNEIPEITNLSIAHQAKKRNMTVLLNAAPWRELSEEMISSVDYLVLNRVEAQSYLFPEEPSNTVTSNQLKNALASHPNRALKVIVTLGAEGVIFKNGHNKNFDLPANNVEVQSSHGAGDMFCGALGSQIARRVKILEALSYSQTCVVG